MAGKIYTVIMTFFAVLLTAIDALYFPFSKIRTGAELLNMGGDNNISFFVYIADYWWAVILILLICYLVWKLYPANIQATSLKYRHLYFVLFIPLGFFVARGGFRLKPLHYTDAVLFAPEGPWPLSLNSGLVFLQSYLDDDGQLFEFVIPSAEPDPLDRQQFIPRKDQPNICILILESFGKEYTGKNESGRPSYTPFLDSLAENSLYFNQFYANGLKSMDAVPALFASVPALFKKPFITSSAAGGRITGMAACLKKIGYSSAFFHGADKGSMGFKPFLLRSGFEKYYSKEDYSGNPADFDGKWGIFDEPFLQFSIRTIDRMKFPFLAGIFTLSSHHPYTIPDRYANTIEDGTLPIHKSIRYTDLALRNFFHEASRHAWFNNTIFIITADHTAMNETPRYQHAAGRYEVPLLIYSPTGSYTGISQKTGQHIDILPTILQMSGYPYPFISVGRSLLDTANEGHAFHYFQGQFSLVQNRKLLLAREQQVAGLYHVSDDPDAARNLYPQNMEEASMLLSKLQKSAGSFQQRVIQNRLSE